MLMELQNVAVKTINHGVQLDAVDSSHCISLKTQTARKTDCIIVHFPCLYKNNGVINLGRNLDILSIHMSNFHFYVRVSTTCKCSSSSRMVVQSRRGTAVGTLTRLTSTAWRERKGSRSSTGEMHGRCVCLSLFAHDNHKNCSKKGFISAVRGT